MAENPRKTHGNPKSSFNYFDSHGKPTEIPKLRLISLIPTENPRKSQICSNFTRKYNTQVLYLQYASTIESVINTILLVFDRRKHRSGLLITVCIYHHLQELLEAVQ